MPSATSKNPPRHCATQATTHVPPPHTPTCVSSRTADIQHLQSNTAKVYRQRSPKTQGAITYWVSFPELTKFFGCYHSTRSHAHPPTMRTTVWLKSAANLNHSGTSHVTRCCVAAYLCRLTHERVHGHTLPLAISFRARGNFSLISSRHSLVAFRGRRGQDGRPAHGTTPVPDQRLAVPRWYRLELHGIC